MATHQDSINASILERIYLKKIYHQFPREFDWKLQMTDEYGYDIYDGEILKFKKNSGQLISRIFVEIKVRDRFYPELMLERKKYNDLLSLVRKRDEKTLNDSGYKIESKIGYVSVTPEGTFWFNLSNIKEFNWESKLCPVSTTDRSLGKTMKEVVMLDTQKARKFEFKTGEILNNDHLVIEKVLVHQAQLRGFTI